MLPLTASAIPKYVSSCGISTFTISTDRLQSVASLRMLRHDRSGGLPTLTAGEWYVFDGASQRGPMSHADVVQFLKDFADRDVVSVWRPGLDDWKPASHLFDIVAPSRLVSASEEVSSKRRYSLYGMYVGLSVVL